MGNDLGLVRQVLADLGSYRLSPVIFGGWAEELRGLISPRQHNDIDLLLLDPDADQLDLFLRSHDEVLAKRSSQKRAFVQDDVCIELFVTRQDAYGWATRFWDRILWIWPNELYDDVDGLPVASPQALALYRESWSTIHGERPAR